MAEETEYPVEYGTRREPEILPIEVVVPESRTAEPVTETPRPSVVDSGYPKLLSLDSRPCRTSSSRCIPSRQLRCTVSAFLFFLFHFPPLSLFSFY